MNVDRTGQDRTGQDRIPTRRGKRTGPDVCLARIWSGPLRTCRDSVTVLSDGMSVGAGTGPVAVASPVQVKEEDRLGQDTLTSTTGRC
jgi:hypothetical protein